MSLENIFIYLKYIKKLLTALLLFCLTLTFHFNSHHLSLSLKRSFNVPPWPWKYWVDLQILKCIFTFVRFSNIFLDPFIEQFEVFYAVYFLMNYVNFYQIYWYFKIRLILDYPFDPEYDSVLLSFIRYLLWLPLAVSPLIFVRWLFT